MTDIREGMEKKIELGIGFGFSPAKTTTEILTFLNDNGLVRKVEGDLPEYPFAREPDCVEPLEYAYLEAQQTMLKAGYSLTEKVDAEP